jgi:hypothetical protein
VERVKILYCYDIDKNIVHYTKTQKGNIYYCIDCGEELICKNGTKKIKHLAHKNTDSQCKGTGESVIHKNYKEHLFVAGSTINIANKLCSPNKVEILEVLNEISLNKRYNKSWDREIIVDTLLITEIGDIVIEINYKNPKDWNLLKPYYDQLDLVRVYEITVDRNINTPPIWHYLGEEEETHNIKEELRLEQEREYEEYVRNKENKKKEKQRIKEENNKRKQDEYWNKIRSGEIIDCKVVFNFKNKLQKYGENAYIITCLKDLGEGKYEKINLIFDLDKHRFDEFKLKEYFSAKSGICARNIVYKNQLINNTYYEVIKHTCDYVDYDKVLYAKLCNIAS